MTRQRHGSIHIDDLARICGQDPTEFRRQMDEAERQHQEPDIVIVPAIEPKRKPAEIVPFPIRRQRAFISAALREAVRLGDGGEKHLKAVIARHYRHLTKIGVAPHLITIEVDALEREFFGTGDTPEKQRA